MRLEWLGAQGEHPPRGGGAQPFAIDQRTIQVVSGKNAWSEGGAQPAPNPDATTERLRQIWLTPHGLVKAAVASGVTADGNTFTVKAEGRDVNVMLEGPTSDARSKVVNELVRKTVPNKPITAVVNTHAHYDHAGGLREYVAEGITVITHESNKDFYEKAWARPRTVEDTAPTSNKPMIETVGDKKVLSDRTHTVELYYLAGHQHHSGQLIAYLPKERILMYGDAYNPPAGEEIRTPERGPEY